MAGREGWRNVIAVAVAVLAALTVISGAVLFLKRDSAVLYRREQPMTADGEPAVMILNPFRDRAPEAEAARFLSLLREGRCPDAISAMPQYTSTRTCQHEERSPLTSWDLKDRQDRPRNTELFYRYKADQGRSEGSLRIWVKRAGTRWAVADYERY